jgi:MbtH protein
MSWGDENTEFLVVINDEGQYSIWPSYKTLPAGWRPEGMRGLKAACLAHIDEVWTDMRPLSLQRALAENSGGGNSELMS